MGMGGELYLAELESAGDGGNAGGGEHVYGEERPKGYGADGARYHPPQEGYASRS